MNIYLDYNIIVELAKNQSMLDHILAAAREKNYSFFYSPAHLEELAHAELDKSRLKLEDYFDVISTLTDNSDIRPLFLYKPIGFYNETPKAVYDRVLNSGEGLEGTQKAENNDKKQLEEGKNRAANMQTNIASELSNISFDKIFDYLLERKYLSCLRRFILLYLWNKYNYLKDRPYQELETAIEVLMKILLHIGYHSDKVSHARSSTHDITHAHYATKCDVFVSNDKKLRSRVAATYHYLGVHTKVLSYDEFKEML